MDNTNVQDTPQAANTQDTSQAFDAPVNANVDSSSELSVDDIILGNVDDTASAFGTPDANQEQSFQENVETPDAKNDPERYQYWHSRAAKLENELDGIRNQQQAIMQQQAMQQQTAEQPPVQPEEVQKFPEAPERPKKPRHYSREEAYSDSNSDSARYLDEVEEWRDNMDEYKDLRHQYDIAIVEDRMMKTEQARAEDIKKQEFYAQKQQQIAQVNQLVQGKYGLSPDESASFIQEMSSDKSLTMDNLVQLWRMNKGQGAPTGHPVPTNPSPTFQQTKRAQQVPSPMGVMPSAGQGTQGSTEDQIMDKMISDLDSKNPFKLK